MGAAPLCSRGLAIEQGSYQAGCGGEDQTKEEHQKPHQDGADDAGGSNIHQDQHQGKQDRSQNADQNGV